MLLTCLCLIYWSLYKKGLVTPLLQPIDNNAGRNSTNWSQMWLWKRSQQIGIGDIGLPLIFFSIWYRYFGALLVKVRESAVAKCFTTNQRKATLKIIELFWHAPHRDSGHSSFSWIPWFSLLSRKDSHPNGSSLGGGRRTVLRTVICSDSFCFNKFIKW